METEISIRTAAEADARELLAVYAPYVENTAITFEYYVPSVEEFSHRITQTLKRYPYLVALQGGRAAGYAYASAFKGRAAYDWAVETTIYLRQDCRGRGLGTRLYAALESALRRQNILNLNACIAYAAGDGDPRLDNASAAFHERLGYVRAARFTKCGYKFGTWYDMIWMEKMLGEHTADPAPFIPFSELPGGAAGL